MAQTKHHGLDRVGWMFTFKAAAYNLIRLPKLLPTGLVRPEYPQGQTSSLGKA